MLQWAYYAGRMMGQLRVMWRDVMKTVQAELDEAGVDIQLPKDLNRQEIARSASQIVKPFTEQVEKAAKEYQSEVKKIEDEYKREVRQLDTQIEAATQTPQASESNANTEPDSSQSTTLRNNGFGTWSGQNDSSNSDQG